MAYISLKRIENYKSYIGHSLFYSRRFGVFDILLTLHDNNNKPKNLSCRRICIILNKTHVCYIGCIVIIPLVQYESRPFFIHSYFTASARLLLSLPCPCSHTFTSDQTCPTSCGLCVCAAPYLSAFTTEPSLSPVRSVSIPAGSSQNTSVKSRPFSNHPVSGGLRGSIPLEKLPCSSIRPEQVPQYCSFCILLYKIVTIEIYFHCSAHYLSI